MASPRVVLFSAPGIALAAALYLASPLVALHLDPNTYEGGRSRDPLDRLRRNTSAVALMLGEFRTSVGDMIFLKTERYLDAGVAYEPHLEDDIASLTQEMEEDGEPEGAEESDHDHAHDHHAHEGSSYAGTPTIIKPPGEDFRGLIGTMHRAIAPYRDPSEEHEHGETTEILPWYRLMTMADPHSVRGYAIGAWWLRDHSVDEALRFIDEGIANNPGSFQLPYTKARLLLLRSGVRMEAEGLWESSDAQPDLREALALARRATAMALEERPADPESDEEWFTHKEEDALGSARLACGIAARLGEAELADTLAREYMEHLGVDFSLMRYAREDSSANGLGQ